MSQVRLPVSRNQDLAMNNGRAAVQVEYDIGYDESGKVLALEMQARLRCCCARDHPHSRALQAVRGRCFLGACSAGGLAAKQPLPQ